MLDAQAAAAVRPGKAVQGAGANWVYGLACVQMALLVGVDPPRVHTRRAAEAARLPTRSGRPTLFTLFASYGAECEYLTTERIPTSVDVALVPYDGGITALGAGSTGQDAWGVWGLQARVWEPRLGTARHLLRPNDLLILIAG